jgi:hypothetical protein
MIDSNKIQTTHINSRNIKASFLNITQDIFLEGNFYVDGLLFNFPSPTPVPTPSPTISPTPRPTFQPTSSLIPGYPGSFGGGWAYVHEPGRSSTNMDDLASTAGGSYTLHSYVISASFNEVLVQRVSANWCDSWGKNTGHWVASSGASMGFNVDSTSFYYFNNEQGAHTWLKQPTSYMPSYGGSCASCWKWQSGSYTYEADPESAAIEALAADGSVVKVHFSETKSKLTVGNFDAFVGTAGGCDAAGAVSYRVFTRLI